MAMQAAICRPVTIPPAASTGVSPKGRTASITSGTSVCPKLIVSDFKMPPQTRHGGSASPARTRSSVSTIGRRIDESQPWVDARLEDGSRVNAIIRPCAIDGPSISIRKFAKMPYTMERLIDNGTLTDDDNMWTFSPKINRIIKVPSSMMSQSWLGSDFSNKDIAKSTDIIEQYDHELTSVEGVAEVASVGGFVREYQIDVDPDAMRAWGVGIDQVYDAVRQSNVDVGARTIEINSAATTPIIRLQNTRTPRGGLSWPLITIETA